MITTLLEMTFANTKGGLNIDLSSLAENDIVKILFSENPGIIIQVNDAKRTEDILEELSIAYLKIGNVTDERRIELKKNKETYSFDIDALRDVWYESSYLLARRQSTETLAKDRSNHYKAQPIYFSLNTNFTGQLAHYGISADRREKSRVKAALVREQVLNGY